MFTYGIGITTGFQSRIGICAGLYGLLIFFFYMFKSGVIMIASGFTIFAPAFCGISACIIGYLCSDYCIRYFMVYGISIPFVISLILSLSVAAVYVTISVYSSAHRAHLKTAAPNVSDFLHSDATRTLFDCAFTSAAIMLALSCAIYFLSLYYPI